MKSLLLIFSLVLHVAQGGSIGAAIDSARAEYASTGGFTTVLIEPGTYYEELTVDVPGLRLVNAAAVPSVALHDGGVRADSNAVRISWYCGHGYQYRSMGDSFNYGGRRTRRWNASVLVTAPGFSAENIIFENSFNQYVSPAELLDSLVDISQAKADWTTNERPKRIMPERPRKAYSTEVQTVFFTERASALSFVKGATGELHNCRIVGRQDALYGDHGATVLIDGGVVQGTVDFIFGGMDITVRDAELVIGAEQGSKQCYIAAGRGFVESIKEQREVTGGQREVTMGQGTKYKGLNEVRKQTAAADSIPTAYGNVPADETAEQGMVFTNCKVRYATRDEVVKPGQPLVYLARPWRWWGRHLFMGITYAPDVLLPDRPVSLGLTKGVPVPWCEIR